MNTLHLYTSATAICYDGMMDDRRNKTSQAGKQSNKGAPSPIGEEQDKQHTVRAMSHVCGCVCVSVFVCVYVRACLCKRERDGALAWKDKSIPSLGMTLQIDKTRNGTAAETSYMAEDVGGRHA